MFDVIIIGGGVSSVSCALIIGSAKNKQYAKDKKVAIITHQRSSSLQDAIFYNAYGVPSGKLGSEILLESLQDLKVNYPHICQFANEKLVEIKRISGSFEVITNKNIYSSRIVVVGVGSSNLFDIKGLENYVIPHLKSLPEKERIQLKNIDHKVDEGIYVCGTLAGHRSQFSIASGSGASVATDILVMWNNGIETHSHDSIRQK